MAQSLMTITNARRAAATRMATVGRLTMAALLLPFALAAAPPPAAAEPAKLALLNVSYDPTRELWRDLNAAFVSLYAERANTALTIRQSHGGSSTQARAVIDGLEADVVTLALWPDVDAIRAAGLIGADWDTRLPNAAVPYTSTIVFVVRKGNPKAIRDWPDLVRPGVEIVTPNPKTSGNGKLSFLAAWGAVTERGGTREEARTFVTALYRQTPVLDLGARAATVTFAQRKLGDVHLTWENEAHLEVAEAKGAVEIVYPPISILAEPPVAVVDGNATRRGTAAAARAYLEFLYSDAGQEIIARHFLRPTNAAILAKHAGTFPEIRRFPITAVAASWRDAHETFFAEGKIFDELYRAKGR